MTKILGIDTGTNSLGWAIVEKKADEYHLLDKGVNIFQAVSYTHLDVYKRQVLMLAEGGESDVAFARWTEADTWSTDYAGTIKHLFEEFPAGRVVWRLHPEIRCILAAIYSQAGFLEVCSHEVGILHIVVDGCLHLCLTLRGVDGFGSTLADIACTIKLGALAADVYKRQVRDGTNANGNR